MTVETFDIEGPLLIRPKCYSDSRGYFFESYNEHIFRDLGLPVNFLQDNQSVSYKNVLRGLHFQLPPWEQGKLVRVVRGAALDVAVDIRPESPSYGKHISVKLSADIPELFWIPVGFAHGFLSLEDNTTFLYKCTNTYMPSHESGIIWNDPTLKIDWGIQQPIVSEKDLVLPGFRNLNEIQFKSH